MTKGEKFLNEHVYPSRENATSFLLLADWEIKHEKDEFHGQRIWYIKEGMPFLYSLLGAYVREIGAPDEEFSAAFFAQLEQKVGW